MNTNFKVLLAALALLLCAGAAGAGALSTSTAANADITVQNSEFKLLFDQSAGGQIADVYDLVNDPAKDIAACMAHWAVKVGSAGALAHYNNYDAAAKLSLGESIGSRVKTTQSGGLYREGHYIDLNSDSTFTVYPNGKIYMRHAFTNVNATSGTNYVSVISFLSAAAGQ